MASPSAGTTRRCHRDQHAPQPLGAGRSGGRWRLRHHSHVSMATRQGPGLPAGGQGQVLACLPPAWGADQKPQDLGGSVSQFGRLECFLKQLFALCRAISTPSPAESRSVLARSGPLCWVSRPQAGEAQPTGACEGQLPFSFTWADVTGSEVEEKMGISLKLCVPVRTAPTSRPTLRCSVGTTCCLSRSQEFLTQISWQEPK